MRKKEITSMWLFLAQLGPALSVFDRTTVLPDISLVYIHYGSSAHADPFLDEKPNEKKNH